MGKFRESFSNRIEKTELYVEALVVWLAAAIVTGILCGLVGSAFHIGVDAATHFREMHPWMLFLMPVAGLLIVGLYQLLHTVGQGTNDILDAANEEGHLLSLLLVPSVFIGTVLTHLVGGSSGREGAALQMGGSIGQWTGRVFRLRNHDLKVATMCGMAAFFSALFGTPLTAAVFAIMVGSVGSFVHMAFLPSLVSAVTAYLVSVSIGVEPTRFAITVPELSVSLLLRVAILAMMLAVVSILFCRILHATEHLMRRGFLADPWKRVITGSLIVIALTCLCRTTDYNGAGMGVIRAAVEEGTARPEAFLLKIIFTAVTLSAGFKGGEVVPSFFVGAVFGCVAAPILGIPAGFGAALGLVGVFCGNTNCMFSSIILSLELFGPEGILYFALVCGIAYMLSGYSGLYSSQTILYSKIRAQYLEVKTNRHHLGEGEDKKDGRYIFHKQ